MVGMSMAGGFAEERETSSWNLIAARAYDIITEYVFQPNLQRRGGINKAGLRGQILIEIFPFIAHLKFLVDLNRVKPPPGSAAGWVGATSTSIMVDDTWNQFL